MRTSGPSPAPSTDHPQDSDDPRVTFAPVGATVPETVLSDGICLKPIHMETRRGISVPPD